MTWGNWCFNSMHCGSPGSAAFPQVLTHPSWLVLNCSHLSRLQRQVKFRLLEGLGLGFCKFEGNQSVVTVSGSNQFKAKAKPAHTDTHTHMPRMVNVYLKLYLYIVWFVCVCAIVVRTPVCQTVSSYVQVTLPERLAQLPQPALLQPVLITSLSDAKWQHCSDTTWKWRVG